jgi:hypothetical protein
MHTVKHPLVAFVACASVVAAGLAAPMMHVHDDDHVTAHHHGRVIHSHRRPHATVARHAAHGSTLESGGDTLETGRPIDLFQMVVGWSAPPAGLPSAIASPPPPAIRTVTVQLLVQHSHDPPLGKTRPSRAPPSFLS